MTWETRLAAEPWKYDMFAILRRIEAANPDKPRLGDSGSRREEYVELGQEPYLEFAASNIASYVPATQDRKARMLVRFLGLLGPMGPLPSSTTDEAMRWYRRREDAFSRFLDIFNGRFLQLFYRAFADARPAEQRARPRDDRFAAYVGASMGVGGKSWQGLDSMPDLEKLRFAGILGARNVSASRIEYLISGSFGVRAEVDQFVGMALELGADEITRIGGRDATLGRGAMLGSRVISVDHKFRLRIFVDGIDAYESFLPGGRWSRRLIDTLENAVGQEYEWEVELVIHKSLTRPARLGSYGRLGWTGWMRGPAPVAGTEFLSARFSPHALGNNARREATGRNLS